jgi:DNA end-binding protein Ku
MPRSLWTGSLSFGLVNVPVALYSGVKDTDVHFRQLHAKDHRPVEVRRVCSKEDEEVSWEDVAHSYETDDGKQVVLTDEELAAASPKRTRTIEIEAFVDLEDVDPIYFDHPYVLLPAGEAEGVKRAYRLLVEVMKSTERAALGRFVLRTKEYLVLVRQREGRLTLTTMLFHDEVRPAKDVPAPGARKKGGKDEVKQALKLVEALSEDWEPSRYKDRYQQRLKKVIKRKQEGETIKLPDEEVESAQPVADLMAALEESLQKVTTRSGGRKKKTAKA